MPEPNEMIDPTNERKKRLAEEQRADFNFQPPTEDLLEEVPTQESSPLPPGGATPTPADVAPEFEDPSVSVGATTEPEADSGFGYYAKDIGRGALSGVEDFGMSVYGLLDTLSGDLLWDWDEKSISAADTVAGSIVQELTHFAVGFMVAGGALNFAAKGLRVAQGVKALSGVAGAGVKAAEFAQSATIAGAAVKGGIVDFAFYEKQNETLSNAIQNTPLANPITELLQADEDDTELEGRLKQTLEGMALGGIFDVLLTGVKTLRKGRKALQSLDDEATAAGKVATEAEKDAAVAGAMDPAETMDAVNRTKAEYNTKHPIPKSLHARSLDESLRKLGLPEMTQVRKRFDELLVVENGNTEEALYKFFRGEGSKLDAKGKKVGGTGINLGQLASRNDAVSAVRAMEEVTKELLGNSVEAEYTRLHTLATKRLKDWMGFDDKGMDAYVLARADSTNPKSALGDAASIESIRVRLTTDMYALTMAAEQFTKGLAKSAEDYVNMSFEELVPHIERLQSLADFVDVVSRPRSSAGRLLQSLQVNLNPGWLVLRENKAVRDTAGEAIAKMLKDSSPRRAKKRAAAMLERLHAASTAAGGNREQFMRTFIANTRAARRDARRPFAMLSEYWFGSLLSGHKTHMVNIASNLFTMLHRPVETLVGGVVQGTGEIVAGLPKGQLNYSTAMNAIYETMDEVAALGSVFFDLAKMNKGDILPAMRRSFKTGSSTILPDSGHELRVINGADRSITGESVSNSFIGGAVRGIFGEGGDKQLRRGAEFLGNTVRKPGQALAAEDELFKQMNARVEAMKIFKKEARALRSKGSTINVGEYVDGRMQRLLREGQVVNENMLFTDAYRRASDELGGGDIGQELLNTRTKEILEAEIEKNREILAVGAQVRRSAEERTFTGDLRPDLNTIHKMGKVLNDAKNDLPIMQFFAPFIKTPTNIMNFAHERLPVEQLTGLIQYLSLRATGSANEELVNIGNRSLRAIANRANDPAEFTNFVSRFSQGMMAVSAFGYLAYNAIDPNADPNGIHIIGQGPKDYAENRAFRDAKKLPYSIGINGRYYSFERLEPFSTMLGTVADAVQYAHFSGKPEDNSQLMYALVMATTANFTNKSYLTGLENLGDLIMSGEPNKIERALQQFAGSWVPAMASQVNSGAVDGTMREVRSMLDAMQNKVPYFSGKLEARRDVLGREMQKIGWDDQWAMSSRWSPVPIRDSERADKVLVELADLKHPWQPAGRSMTLGGVEFDLYDYENDKGQMALDRYRELSGSVKIRGKTLHDTLSSLIASPQYQALPKVTGEDTIKSLRVQAVSGIITTYRQVAKQQLLQEFPEILQVQQEKAKGIFQ